MKIIDQLKQKAQLDQKTVSFEYYPPKCRDHWPAFYEKVERMSKFAPDFIDVTWGTGDPTSFASLEVADQIQRRTGIETMMHLTCTHRSRTELLAIVDQLIAQTPIRNLMALRGNRPLNGNWVKPNDGFASACELVRALRERFGAQLGISVAGYPEGHREDGLPPDPAYVRTPGYFKEIDYLRQKVSAGADFVVTQLCFDMDQLCRYRDDCVSAGIQVPIIPGLLPLHSHRTWQKIAMFSASIPASLAQQYDRHRDDDDEALQDFALDLLDAQKMRLFAEGFVGIHLYTLNHERLLSSWFSRNAADHPGSGELGVYEKSN